MSVNEKHSLNGFSASIDRRSAKRAGVFGHGPSEPTVVVLGSICGLLFDTGRIVIGGHGHVLFDGVLP